MNVSVRAEPRHLSLGIMARCDFQALDRGRQGAFSAKIGEKLLISDRLCGSFRYIEHALLKQALCFVEKSVLKHLFNAAIDPLVEKRTTPQKPHDSRQITVRIFAPLTVDLAFRLSARKADLKRADHATNVIGMDLLCRLGIARYKSLIKRPSPVFLCKLGERRPKGGIAVGAR